MPLNSSCQHRWVAILAAVVVLVTHAAAKRDVLDKDSTYLFPFLVCGPNNQRRDLRNFLSLGLELDRRVVVTGVNKHYSDLLHKARMREAQLSANNTKPTCFHRANDVTYVPGKLGYMPGEKIFDMDYLADSFDAVTVSEMMAQGWDGKLDALVFPQEAIDEHWVYINKTMRTTNVSLERAVNISLPLLFLNCNKRTLEDLKEVIAPYRYVGIVKVGLAKTVIPNLVHEENVEVDELRGCQKSLALGNRALRPAKWIQTVADKYIDTYIKTRDFLCMQIRPYPDSCLAAWRDGQAVPGKLLTGVCNERLEDFHDRVGPCAAMFTKSSGTKKVFAMAHPALSHVIHNMLTKSGIDEVFHFLPHHIDEMTECSDHSATFMSMIESAICSQASSFIGTHISSVTQSLGFDRLGMGRKPNAYFESLTNC